MPIDKKTRPHNEDGTFAVLYPDLELSDKNFTIRLPKEVDSWLRNRSDRTNIIRDAITNEVKRLMDNEPRN